MYVRDTIIPYAKYKDLNDHDVSGRKQGAGIDCRHGSDGKEMVGN